ncbi:MAG: DUF4040 domain-containing protein [Lachnospiraceae bacterium]|jgi:energy-converting hydrogenase B subunit D|nr:DUF4040 domain-containing protein [Lachnospiraceae bacterium]MCI1726523.1 DUF4040 domain-containing protein [Lachnospiraceae bacterium]
MTEFFASYGITILNTIVMAGVVVTALLAVIFDRLLSSVIALGITGAFAALEFILLEAPDVAIAEASVGAVLSTVLFVIALRKTTKKGDEDK